MSSVQHQVAERFYSKCLNLLEWTKGSSLALLADYVKMVGVWLNVQNAVLVCAAFFLKKKKENVLCASQVNHVRRNAKSTVNLSRREPTSTCSRKQNEMKSRMLILPCGGNSG
jgi:hypothetical protein